MTTVPDLEPAARQLITLAAGVTDDMLQAPTPCERSWLATAAIG